ncbi:hypothetical protein EWM64_g9769 [Hericium alpestre]|uniref:Uncharacterized protein n=1 Tax=Hericium alpestre TaxID=135208 RepID=A0A4Y9ZK20_9AGAM|nr:hypothetical protein EWM64_g9769 [Hericium alpestre]
MWCSSSPSPVPAILRMLVDTELDEETESLPHQYDEPAVEPALLLPSNQTNIDRMVPVFTNILRCSLSSNSLPYNRSPLHNAIIAHMLLHRRRGATSQETHLPSLIGQPEALVAELGLGMAPVAESALRMMEVETAEFSCQMEEIEVEMLPPIQIMPAAPETVKMEGFEPLVVLKDRVKLEDKMEAAYDKTEDTET